MPTMTSMAIDIKYIAMITETLIATWHINTSLTTVIQFTGFYN